MTVRIMLIAAALVATSTTGCATAPPARDADLTASQVAPDHQPADPSASPPEVVDAHTPGPAPRLMDADPLHGPCQDTCDHIVHLTAADAGSPATLAWLADCRAACVEHASKGQIACYQRVAHQDELVACMAR